MVVNSIYEWARSQPDKTALASDDTIISYAVLARAVDVTRTFLESQNLPVGGTAVIVAANLATAWILALGARSAGLDAICAQSAQQVASLTGARFACFIAPQVEQAMHNLKGAVPAGARILVVPQAIYAAIKQGEIPSPRETPMGGQILLTSGTTGAYKKVLFDAATERERNLRWAAAINITQATVHHGLNFPLWTSIGVVVPGAVWTHGASIITEQRPDMAARFYRSDVTSVCAPPAILKNLVDHAPANSTLPRSVDIIVGGGYLPHSLARTAHAKLSDNIYPVFASTEHQNYMKSHFRDADDLIWLSPCEDDVFQIIRDDGTRCEDGEEGKLRVRLSDIDCNSYLDDEAATAEFFKDGYFYPGDIAVRRADGRIRVLGRAADVLNVRGFKIAIAPIEQQIQQLLNVANVCLFGGVNASGEEELLVAIETDRLPPQNDLARVAQAFAKLGPMRFEAVSAFPRTQAGMQKIKRTELRALAFGGTAGP